MEEMKKIAKLTRGDSRAFHDGSWVSETIFVSYRNEYTLLIEGGCNSSVSEETDDGYVPGSFLEYIDEESAKLYIEKWKKLAEEDEDDYYSFMIYQPHKTA